MLDPRDVFLLKEWLWPDVRFYDKQVEIIESCYANDETFVVAGNQLGKDFVASFICVCDFLMCMAKGMSCKVVTTSVAERHLKVLWGEIGRWVTTAKRPLIHERGGCLVMNFQEIKRADELAAKNPLSYLVGLVSAKGEGLSGHHAEFTRFVGDEASGMDDVAYEMSQGWAKKVLIFGNPFPCDNFFFRGVQGGDIKAA